MTLPAPLPQSSTTVTGRERLTISRIASRCAVTASTGETQPCSFQLTQWDFVSASSIVACCRRVNADPSGLSSFTPL